MGYDGPLKQAMIDALPESLSKARTVRDLWKTDEGLDWWHDHGDSLPVTFSLAKDSSNLKIWSDYWIDLPEAEKAKAMDRLKGEESEPGSRGKPSDPGPYTDGFTYEQILEGLDFIRRYYDKQAEEERQAKAPRKRT